MIIIVFYYLFIYTKTQQLPLKCYVFQTSDIHGHLDNMNTKYSGGWLKMGNTIRSEIEKIGGYKNCLLIDCGDTFQGTIEASEAKGKFASSILNNLKYDIFVPGNHDLDFGLDIFLNRINDINADIIAANLTTNVYLQKKIFS